MNSCPICNTTSDRAFFEMRGVPVSEGFLGSTREEAVRVDLVDIVYHYCHTCGHIWNAAYDPDKLQFNPDYDISMFHSASYRAYVDDAIERLKTRYDLEGKVALDIACGKGEFARALIAHGFGHVYGFDPSFEDSFLSESDRRSITAHRAFYGEAYSSLKVDIVTCRSAMQFFTKPGDFLQSVRATLADQPDTILGFEVPNAEDIFGNQNIWPITNDYPYIYSPASLARLFRENGFQVLDIVPAVALGGSHMEIEAKPGGMEGVSRFESRESIDALASRVESFAHTRAERTREWAQRLADEQAAGRTVALWGAGARALSFLCALPDLSAIRFAVDVNPARQDRFLPKVGLQVVAPEQLKAAPVDLVVATNPNFATEIRGQIEALDLKCDFDVLR
jgi:2-polyprenyl-3-methyl-5-hydroxy-6-metoxy-1,4-benzoquinol methylase